MSESDGGRVVSQEVYTGLDEQHNVSWIQRVWRDGAPEELPDELRNLEIDQRLASIVERAILGGRRDFVMLDVGSGSKGYFLRELLEETSFPRLHKLLEDNPGFSFRAVGLTGAEGREQGASISTVKKNIGPGDEELKSSLVAENYGYTVTRAHTLSQFLKDRDIEKIDICFSTFGLGYFTPANFEQCVVDIVNNLSDGGELFGLGWDAVPAGTARLPMGRAFYMIPKELGDTHPLNRLFGDTISKGEYERFYDKPPQEQIRDYLDVIEFCISKGYISLEEVKSIFANVDLLPVPAFVREVNTYISDEDRGRIKNAIRLTSFLYLQYKEVNLTQDSELFEELKKAKLSESVINSIWDYIEDNFALPLRKKMDVQKDSFNQSIPNSSWGGIRSYIESLDPTYLAKFWDWNRLVWKFQQIFIDKQENKTSRMKRETFDRLAKRSDLDVHARSTSDVGRGLNVYIGKRKMGVNIN